MSHKVFIDSNIWLYAFITVTTSPKWQQCIALLESLHRDQTIIVSTQVIHEVHWNLMRKYRTSDAEAKLIVDTGILNIATLSVLNQATYDDAFNLRQKYLLSFWDSLIVASALENQCTRLYSEDLQHNQLIENTLIVVNPLN